MLIFACVICASVLQVICASVLQVICASVLQVICAFVLQVAWQILQNLIVYIQYIYMYVLYMPDTYKRMDIFWFGLVSLFNGISTFVGYLMPKPCS